MIILTDVGCLMGSGTINECWAQPLIVLSHAVCHNGRQRTPHNVLTESLASLIFLFTFHDGLSVVVVVSRERFLFDDVMHVVNCKLQMMIDRGATYSLSCLSAMTLQECMTLKSPNLTQ